MTKCMSGANWVVLKASSHRAPATLQSLNLFVSWSFLTTSYGFSGQLKAIQLVILVFEADT